MGGFFLDGMNGMNEMKDLLEFRGNASDLK